MPSCYANPTPIFRPAARVIASITNSDLMHVTTTTDHQYLNGLIVRLNIPRGVGMEQANGLFGPITVTGADSFIIPINSINFTPFAIPFPAPAHYTCAQVVPFAEINETLASAIKNYLPFN